MHGSQVPLLQMKNKMLWIRFEWCPCGSCPRFRLDQITIAQNCVATLHIGWSIAKKCEWRVQYTIQILRRTQSLSLKTFNIQLYLTIWLLLQIIWKHLSFWLRTHGFTVNMCSNERMPDMWLHYTRYLIHQMVSKYSYSIML